MRWGREERWIDEFCDASIDPKNVAEYRNGECTNVHVFSV